MKETILLSICIPTYGRDKILEQNLTHLTNLKIFSDSQQWEIVISDNASPDSTQAIGSRFASLHPTRIRYFRNETNVCDDNFRLALSRGEGRYLKLCNDTLLLTDSGIREMLACVEEFSTEKPNLYFRNITGSTPRQHCYTFDDFIYSVGHMCTWIAEYGIWREDFEKLNDFGRASKKMLIQVDATFRMLAKKPHSVILRRHFFDLMPKPFHRGFEPSFIFGQNYFSLLKPYVKAGLVSSKALDHDKYGMFRYVILPNYLITKPEFQYTRVDYLRNLWPEYKNKWYFYFFYPFTLAAIPIAWFRRFILKA